MNNNLKRLVILLIAVLALIVLALPVGASNPGQEIVYFDKAYNAAESAAAGFLKLPLVRSFHRPAAT